MEQQLFQLASTLGENLLARSWQVTCAESCTGGGIAAAITSVAGSSDWFGVGYVTYSNVHKERVLGVSPTDLDAYGAVSRQVVAAMARGAKNHSGANIAVAVSGVAGPGGGSVKKPVGTVWIAWNMDDGEDVRCYHFEGDRTAVRAQTVIAAMEGLIQYSKNTV